MAVKKATDRIPFTEEEKKLILKSNYRELKALALAMGRSHDSLRKCKWRMENRERDNQKKNEAQRKRRAECVGFNTRNVWTKHEEEFIMTSDLPDSEIAKQLGRTPSSIACKRQYMKRINALPNVKKGKKNG